MKKLIRALSSLRTGIVLLILTGVASIAGTVILQRPLTEAANLERLYSPATLRWLDRLGLTDVFHTWWFGLLLALLSINIVLASLERFPNAWRYFARPHRVAEPRFLASQPLNKAIPVRDMAAAIAAAESAFRDLGLRPQRIGEPEDVSLFAEKHRFSRLAAYVVHTALLLIFAGGIADAIWGYRGFVAIPKGGAADTIELQKGGLKPLGFVVHCEAAGQENYPDGTPKRWWSKLTVLEDGQVMRREEIEVNKPMVYRGLRFFQSSYGPDYTGLAVAYEPGQWGVWGGCVLMAIGLSMAFYFVHVRYWAVPVRDDKGRLTLWVAVSPGKNREEFGEQFRALVETIERGIHDQQHFAA
jgi:cytochrome c biogenesis protein